MKLASGFCIPEPLPVHTGIKRRQVHPLIRFLLRSRVDEKSADLHKAFQLCFVPGWRNGEISGVPLISDSPGLLSEKLLCISTRSPFIPAPRGGVRVAKHARQLSLPSFVNTRS